MSDNWLRFIPTDPEFLPTQAAAAKAQALLASIVPQSTEVTVQFTEHVEFMDQGANFESVACPRCEANAESWWGDAMSEQYKTRFSNLRVTAPCCGATVSLNELNYKWPCGFSRFVLEAMNPNVRDIAPDQVAELEETLGCPLRVFWRHL
jgi:hypothetical protein